MRERYSNVPGGLVFAEDMMHTNALVYHYLVRGKPEMQKQLCNQWFNVPWQNKYRVSPLNGLILVSFVNSSCSLGLCEPSQWRDHGCLQGGCSRSILKDHDGSTLGLFKFNLLSLSIVLAGIGGQPYLFSPYTFCDDGTVTVNYREMLGWNVLLAEFDFPKLPIDANRQDFTFNCAMDVPIPEQDPTRPSLENFVRLGEFDSTQTADHTDLGPFEDRGLAFNSLTRHLNQLLSADSDAADRAAIGHLTSAMTEGALRLGLRQFRGTTSGERAIFQAIQSFGVSDFRFRAGGIIPTGQTMHFGGDSELAKLHFPMRNDLGLPEEAPVLAGFWSLIDYTHWPQAVNWSGVKRT